MTPKRFVSAALVAALVTALVPLPARAGDRPVAPGGLRASIDRAATQALETPQQARSVTPGRRDGTVFARRGAGGMGGGGGSKVWMAYAVVGLAGSLAATYFIIKQTQKTSSAAQGQ